MNDECSAGCQPAGTPAACRRAVGRLAGGGPAGRLPALLPLLCALLFACGEAPEFENTAIPVRTEVVKRTEFAPTMTLLGVVRAAQSIPVTSTQRGTIRFAPRFAGGLETGAEVKRGELLAEVRNDQMLSARAQAKLEMEAADADFQRAKLSHEQGVMSSAEYSAYRYRAQLRREAYNSSAREVGTLRIVAPAAGRLVVTKPRASGTVIDSGTALAEIASGGAPFVESSVAASARDALRPGLVVRFSSPSWNGTGRLTEVASVIDATGTARVVAALDAHATLPPPGSGVELRVELDRKPETLTLPEEAIVAGTDGPSVFVAATAEGYRGRFRVRRVSVEPGGRAEGRVEVRSGLRDGDRVVVTGADALADDTVVVETETKS